MYSGIDNIDPIDGVSTFSSISQQWLNWGVYKLWTAKLVHFGNNSAIYVRFVASHKFGCHGNKIKTLNFTILDFSGISVYM